MSHGITAQDVQTVLEFIALAGGAGYLRFGPYRSNLVSKAQQDTIDAYSARLKLVEDENKDCQKEQAVLLANFQSLQKQYDWLADLVKINTANAIVPLPDGVKNPDY